MSPWSGGNRGLKRRGPRLLVASYRDVLRHFARLGAAMLAIVGSLPTGTGMPKPVVPPKRPWAVAEVANLKLASSLVGLPGTPYAYTIEVASTSPPPPEGRLVRLDLSTGRVVGGPNLPSASGLTVIGDRMVVLVPVGGHYQLRFAASAGAGAKLSAGVELDWKGWAPQLINSPLPLVRGGIWLASAHGAKLFSVTTGRVLAALGFRAEVSDLSESPGGDFLYVALDELFTNPLAKVSTMVDEFDATDRARGRSPRHRVRGRRTVLTPVPGGVWVAYRTGMAGSAVLLSVSRAATGATPKAGTPVCPGPSVRGRTDHGLLGCLPRRRRVAAVLRRGQLRGTCHRGGARRRRLFTEVGHARVLGPVRGLGRSRLRK